MNQLNIEQFYPKLKNCLIDLGDEIHRLRRSPQFRIMVKPDDTLVTNVDYHANDILTHFISREFPQHFIVGEESENKTYPSGAEYIWYIDPIDGTKQFTTGSADFFVLLGLVAHGSPYFGAIYKPSDNTLITGMDDKVLMHDLNNDKRYSLAPQPWALTQLRCTFKQVPAEQRAFLKSDFGIERAEYINKYIELTAPLFGLSNGYVSHRRTFLWDYAAPAAIMKAVGYQVEGLNQKNEIVPLNLGEYVVSSCYALPKNLPSEILQALLPQQL